MDLGEWEFVSDDGFLEIHDDGGRKIFSRKATSPRNDFSTNYIGCPSLKSNQFVDSTEESVLPKKQLIPLSIQLDDPISDHPIIDLPDVVVKKLTTNITPEPTAPSVESGKQDSNFQVSVKKTEENEFADMKIDSPKSGSMEFSPQIEAGTIQFEEKSDSEGIKDNNSDAKVQTEKEEDRMDLWKGVGAICSFGMAAATIGIMIFGNTQTNKHNQKLQIQIYSDDKRINQVVEQATKLNEAISSAVRGVPLTRAHITSGGYYDGL